MDNTNTKPVSSFMLALQMGLRFGALGIVYQLIMFFTGVIEQGGSLWALLLFLTCGVLSVRYIRQYRDNQLGGKINFGKAFGICLQSFIYAGILFSLFTVVLIFYIHPQTIANMIKLEHYGITINDVPPERTETVNKIKAFFNSPLFMFIRYALNFSFMGVLASFIVAPICKKEDEDVPVAE